MCAWVRVCQIQRDSHSHLPVYGRVEYPYTDRARQYKFSGESMKEKMEAQTKDDNRRYMDWIDEIKLDAHAA